MKTSKRSILTTAAAAVLMLLALSCSDLKKNLPTAVNLSKTVHAAGWMDTASAAFHGKVLLQQLAVDSTATAQCGKCHGVTVKKTCADCHGAVYPHSAAWKSAVSDTARFHGAYLKKKGFVLTECASCHGSTYTGGSSGKSCYTCHTSYPHTMAWTTVASGQSHGQYLKVKSWNSSECQSCHGATYTGGSSGQACYACHSSYPHPANIDNAHPGILQATGYPLAQCQTCHGASYTGGTIANVTCEGSGCHRDASNTPKSPESCNTCHGQFRAAAAAAQYTFAPPKSVIGDSLTSVAAVGAHQKHLATNTFGATVACAECHTVPGSTFAAGHLNAAGQAIRGDVLFNGPLARTATAVTPNPSYDLGTNKCNNTYCHGNFRLRASTSANSWIYSDSVMVGANFSPVWNGTNQAACGTCHGLPPTGHDASDTNCGDCHSSVDPADPTKIIDKTKHINGQLDL